MWSYQGQRIHTYLVIYFYLGLVVISCTSQNTLEIDETGQVIRPKNRFVRSARDNSQHVIRMAPESFGKVRHAPSSGPLQRHDTVQRTVKAPSVDNKEIGEDGVLAETSVDDEDQQNANDLAAKFSQIDSNEDGSADKAKARRAGSRMAHVDKLDGNKDGRIDVVEFEAMSPVSIEGKGDPDRPEESEQVEDEHDANGTIALAELDEVRNSGRRRTCPNDIPIMENGVKLTGKYDYAAGSPFQDVDGFIKNCYCDCEAPSGWTHLEEARRRSWNRRRRGQIGDGQYYIQFMSHWGQWHRRRGASDACRCAKVKKSSGKVHIEYKWNDGSLVQQSLGTCNSDPTDEFTDQDCYYESCLLHDVCLLKFGHSTCTPYANAREAANGWSCER